jgi:dimethylargininase
MCDQHVGTAIVRRPGPRVCEGLVTFQERDSVNAATALLQWLDYVETFRRHGWKIVEVEPADDCPDAVFIEVWSIPLLSFAAPFTRFMQDCVVFFGSTAVITRPGAVSRRPEIPAAERLVRTLGCRCISSRFIALPATRAVVPQSCSVTCIHDPGTLDGGDVLKVGKTVYVGSGSRSNAEGGAPASFLPRCFP